MSQFRGDPTTSEPSSSTASFNPHDIVTAIQCGDRKKLLTSVQTAREILSRQFNLSIIDSMIHTGLVPLLVQILDIDSEDETDIQFEAAWALTNIASGNSEQTKTVIEAGAIPKFTALLSSAYSHIVEQAVWALGNIAGDGPEARDLVLSHGVMVSLLRLIEAEPLCPMSHHRIIVWTICNLCRNKKTSPDFNAVRPCIPYLSRLLYYNDNDVLANACWAFVYLLDGPNEAIQAVEKIQTVVDQNVIPKLVELLGSNVSTVVTSALRVIRKIVAGTDDHADAVIQAKVLPKLKLLLNSPRNNLVKEAARTVAYITAGTSDQIQKMMDAHLLPDIINVLQNGDFQSRRDAAWAVHNFTWGCSIFQLFVFLNMGLVPAFCNLLDSKDWKTIRAILYGILNILNLTKKVEEHRNVLFAIEECGGLDKIEELQNHSNDQIYKKAFNLIKSFFSDLNREEGIVVAS